MNREIEFRGMCINGSWVHGNLSVLTKKFKDVPAGYYISNSGGAPFAYEIRPETVGQFTGLLDKNGVKIFEGHELNNKYVVVYESPSYVLINILSGDISQFYENESTYEITREYAQMEKD